MLEVFVLLIFCSSMAYLYARSRESSLVIGNDYEVAYEQRINHYASQIVFVVIGIVMALFAGLRTTMNDTQVYLENFSEMPNTLAGISSIDWTVGANPLFNIYQIIIRSLISHNGYVFLLISSCIIVLSYLLFLKKYSVDFGFCLFHLIAFTVYAFTMAAMKQTFATAIAIWAIPEMIKGKKLKPVMLILLAMLIHPYVVIYFVAFFVSDNIWNKKIYIFMMAAFIGKFFFLQILDILLNFSTLFGDDYMADLFEGKMSIFRVLVYLVVPVLSFVYRNNIRKNGDKFSFVCVNLAIVSACFAILASSGGAIMIGRMANYFGIFQSLALAVIFEYGIKNKHVHLLKIVSIACFCFFYYTYYSKYTLELGGCVYNHITLLELIRTW